MKTIRTMMEEIKEYLKPEATTISVLMQKQKSLRTEDTVGKINLKASIACQVFGDYELIMSQVATYEDGDNKYPCIKCLIYIPEIK